MSKKWLFLLIVLGLFIAGIVGGWIYSNMNKNTSSTSERDSKRLSLANQTEASAEKIIGTGGKTSDAAKVYENAIKTADSTGDNTLKYTFLLDEATLYFNDGQFDKALSYALQAESVIKNDNVEQFIAQIYEKKGDKKSAIEYYQNAINVIDKSNPMAQANLEYYKSKISELGG